MGAVQRETGRVRRGIKVPVMLAGLVVANLAAWAWALVALRHFPVLLGTAFLAYGYGLRHAVDADHIAAIDNATRKLMAAGRQPASVGLFFSLGHSTIVVLASLGIALAATALRARFAPLREVGGLVGTSVSVLFLFAIAGVNFSMLPGLWRAFRRRLAGDVGDGGTGDGGLDQASMTGGLYTRLLRPVFRLVSRSWHMYAVGFLFGLGFDTATEIGLLGITAAETARGMPVWSILVFPALFTAGMSLIDTLDSVLMTGAYGWAFTRPARKLYYNLTVTAISVLVALLVGGVEALGLIGDQLGLGGAFWDGVAAINDNFGAFGFLIVALFAVCWLVSMAIYRLKRYDRIDALDTGAFQGGG
jgi:high-affinity nickel-transport protein